MIHSEEMILHIMQSTLQFFCEQVYCICPAVTSAALLSTVLLFSGLNACSLSFRCFQVWQWKIYTWIVKVCICQPVVETLVHGVCLCESLYLFLVYFLIMLYKVRTSFSVLLVITIYCISVISCMHKIRLNCNLCNYRKISTEMFFKWRI